MGGPYGFVCAQSRLSALFRMWSGSLRFVAVGPTAIELSFVGGATEGSIVQQGGNPLDSIEPSHRHPVAVNPNTDSTTSLLIQCPFVSHYRSLLIPLKPEDLASPAPLVRHNTGFLTMRVGGRNNPQPRSEVKLYVAFADTLRMAVPYGIPSLRVSPVNSKPDRYPDEGGVISISDILRITNNPNALPFSPEKETL